MFIKLKRNLDDEILIFIVGSEKMKIVREQGIWWHFKCQI